MFKVGTHKLNVNGCWVGHAVRLRAVDVAVGGSVLMIHLHLLARVVVACAIGFDDSNLPIRINTVEKYLSSVLRKDHWCCCTIVHIPRRTDTLAFL